jgi:hypothetical protein
MARHSCDAPAYQEKAARNKSLFASFSSEKEDSFVLLSYEKEPKRLLCLRRGHSGEIR